MGNTFELSSPSPPLGENTLFEMRKLFIQTSLRYDLIKNGDVDANKDNGANFLLNAGQKWLDLHSTHTKESEKVFGVWEEGAIKIVFDDIMVVDRITLMDSEARVVFSGDATADYLIVTPTEFRVNNPSLISVWDSSLPSECCVGVIGVAGALSTTTAANFDSLGIVDYDEVVFGNSYKKTAIVFNTKADKDYPVEVIARTFSRKLVLDTDYSFWSTAHREMLIQAACMVAETFMKNTTGVEDYKRQLLDQLNTLDDMVIEQQMLTNPTSEIRI